MKQKPIDQGPTRVCGRHDKYVKECPRCNQEARVEIHAKNQQGIPIAVPVYRKRVIVKNKYKTTGEKNVN